jgi:hypothetical protein
MGDGFWEHAFDSFGDNIDIIGSVLEDVADNLNPLGDQFLSGDARNTAETVERQLAAAEGRDVDQSRIENSAQGGLELIDEGVRATASDVQAETGKVLSGAAEVAGGALDLVTNPWVIGAVGVVVLAVFAAPYVVPAVVAVTK